MEHPFDWENRESAEARSARRRGRALLAMLLILLLVLCAVAFTLLRDRLAAQGAAEASPSPAVSAAATESGEPIQGSAPQAPPADAGLLVSFLDVGQGDCIFLRAPSGKTMLVDGGPEGSFPVIDAYLSALGVAGLDVVLASHLHEDHIGGLIKVVDSYPIGEFYYPPFGAESETVFQLLDALKESQAVVKQPLAGVDTMIPWDDDVDVRILAPYDTVYEDFNDTSYILRVRYGSTAVLLTGDSTDLGERLALKAQPNGYFRADVLKVAHHGSADSTFEEFLDAVSPAIAVISVGAGNPYEHPDLSLLDRLLERGITVYRTDQDGTITLLLDGTSVSVIQ
ncbi:MAG: MBL fold metallo-hydrolase [Clostridiales bacterium]|nr:MBL fold metallo-hydrolase [Clostridiales bacterium]